MVKEGSLLCFFRPLWLKEKEANGPMNERPPTILNLSIPCMMPLTLVQII